MSPIFIDPCEHRLTQGPLHRRPMAASQMFLIRDGLAAFRREHPDDPVYDASQGDGGASLAPIAPEELVDAYARFLSSSETTAYGRPEGDMRVRTAIFERYYRLDGIADLSPTHLITTAGGRDALQKFYQAIAMHTRMVGRAMLVGSAPWQSYAQGGYLNGLNLLRAPDSADFRITPEMIGACVSYGQAHRSPVVAMIITTPDNPTGVFLSLDEIVELVETAVEQGIEYVLLDLMYEMVLDEGFTRYDLTELWCRISPIARQRLTILGGLTKGAGASNVRHAHLLCGNLDLAKTVTSIASHTVLTPLSSEAVAYAFYHHDQLDLHPWARRVRGPTARSRALFRDWVREHGHHAIVGQGYYGWLHIGRFLGETMATVDDLVGHLTRVHGLAVIPGSVFHQSEWIRFSLANAPGVTQGAITRLHAALRTRN